MVCVRHARRLVMQLTQPALSYLMHHVVAGRCLLPGAAMFEAAAAAGANLAEAAGLGLCLTGVSIPAPVVLQAGSGHSLTYLVDSMRGGIELQESSLAGLGMNFQNVLNTLLPASDSRLLNLKSKAYLPLSRCTCNGTQHCCRCKILLEGSIQPCKKLCVHLGSLQVLTSMDSCIQIPAIGGCRGSVQVNISFEVSLYTWILCLQNAVLSSSIDCAHQRHTPTSVACNLDYAAQVHRGSIFGDTAEGLWVHWPPCNYRQLHAARARNSRPELLTCAAGNQSCRRLERLPDQVRFSPHCQAASPGPGDFINVYSCVWDTSAMSGVQQASHAIKASLL